MNREQKRAFMKKAKKDGLSKAQAELFVRLREGGAAPDTDPNDISEGQHVMLNVDAIKSRPDYDKMRDEYKAFVEGGEGKTFTAHIAQQGKSAKIISLNEDPRWYFWCGDLIRVEYINEVEPDYEDDDDFFDYEEDDNEGS